MLFSEIVDEFYEPKEYPALALLLNEWERTKPFDGLRVLAATPIFRNTMVQYMALLAGGAILSVGRSLGKGSAAMPFDSEVVEYVRDCGVPVVTDEDLRKGLTKDDFDLILDCAGQFSFCKPRYGFVELTRSGVQFFENSEAPVYVADSGIVKRIETILGTGDGYFRGLEYFRSRDFEGKNLVVFGSGKVGCGIALQGVQRGMNVRTVTDKLNSGAGTDFSDVLTRNNVQIVDFRDETSVAVAIGSADYLVTATGKKNVLSESAVASLLSNDRLIVANMGVEDELGKGVSADRALNAKAPLNFVLEEPTHLKYIDASLALHAALGEQLLADFRNIKEGELPFSGPQDPPMELEQRLILTSMQNGVIGDEIYNLLT